MYMYMYEDFYYVICKKVTFSKWKVKLVHVPALNVYLKSLYLVNYL